MASKLLQLHKSMQEFYDTTAVKKRLESEDPVRGAFELAYFDTQRTLWGIGKNPNRVQIKQNIFEIVLKRYTDIAEHFEHYSLRDYDGSLLIACEQIIATGDNFDHKIYFGQAQKIVNMFFKYILLVDDRLGEHLNYFHVPCDGVILKGIADSKEFSIEIRAHAKACMPWSKMEDYKAYRDLQEALRGLYENPIIFEFEAWSKWKK